MTTDAARKNGLSTTEDKAGADKQLAKRSPAPAMRIFAQNVTKTIITCKVKHAANALG